DEPEWDGAGDETDPALAWDLHRAAIDALVQVDPAAAWDLHTAAIDALVKVSATQRATKGF
ncbi:hypothetical protein T484DRAFT_1767946, partial [Baffinella frigidus]